MNKTIAVLLSVMMPLAASAQATDAAALFARYVQVVNAGDKSGLRALISEDVERSPYRGCTAAMSNRDCLIAYIANTVLDRHGHIKPTDSYGVDGDTIYAGLELRSDVIRAAGVERVFGIDKIKIKNNQITGLAFLPNLQDAQTRTYFEHIRATGTPSAQPVN
jgi:hypothetical protein